MRRKTKERHQSGGGNKQQQQQSKVKEETKQELAMRPTTDQQSNGTTTGTGGGGKTEDLLKANSENGELQAEVKDGNSRSPMPIRMPPVPTLQLHQRCGVPEAAENGGEEAPHSTKSLKHQQSNADSKAQVATIATGRIGPIAITVRASRAPMPLAPPSQQQNGGGGVDNGNDDDISIGGRHFYAMGSPQFQQQQQMNGEGGSTGSSSTSAQASEQSSALVKIEARKVNCKSSDGELFVVDWYLMQQSKLFKRCWEEHRLALKKKSGNGRSRKFVFGMDSVDAATFRLVIEWLVQHDGMDDPAAREDPVTGERMWFELTEFERRFFDQPIEIINNLLNAGKSLDITSLYLFGCQQMAAILQSKSPSAIREMLGLENDMSPSEIAAIRRRNRKFKMRELKAAKYADRLQQLQSQLGNMDTKAAIENANRDGDEAEADEDAGKQQRPEKKEKPRMVRHGKIMAERLMQDRLQQGKPLDGKLMAEQLMLATGRDILPKKNEE